jgi:hypothetical protein
MTTRIPDPDIAVTLDSGSHINAAVTGRNEQREFRSGGLRSYALHGTNRVHR